MTKTNFIWRVIPRWAAIPDRLLPVVALAYGPSIVGVVLICALYAMWIHRWNGLAQAAGILSVLFPFLLVTVAWMLLARASEPSIARTLIRYYGYQERPASQVEQAAPFLIKPIGRTTCRRILSADNNGRHSLVAWTFTSFSSSRTGFFEFTIASSTGDWPGSLDARNAGNQRKLNRAFQSARLPSGSTQLDGWPHCHHIRTDDLGLRLGRTIGNDPACRDILDRWGGKIDSITILNGWMRIQIVGRPLPTLGFAVLEFSERVSEFIAADNDNRPAEPGG